MMVVAMKVQVQASIRDPKGASVNCNWLITDHLKKPNPNLCRLGRTNFTV